MKELQMSNPTKDEGPGWCPFCDITSWRICDHFTGYVRGDKVAEDVASGRAHYKLNIRPKRADEVAVDTGVSVRAYRKHNH